MAKMDDETRTSLADIIYIPLRLSKLFRGTGDPDVKRLAIAVVEHIERSIMVVRKGPRQPWHSTPGSVHPETAKTERRDMFVTWDELDEDDRNVVRERIANGELPDDFRVTEHLFWIGAPEQRRYLSTAPIEGRKHERR
jgi:hypothetical protein